MTFLTIKPEFEGVHNEKKAIFPEGKGKRSDSFS